MTRLLRVLLTLLFLLSGPAMGQYSDFECWSNAANIGASSALQGARLGGQAPDFIVSPGGTVFTVPKGASGPFPVRTGKGFEYTGGSGGNGLSQRTTDVRIMDPVTSGKYQYPGGYGSYGNTSGQAVNPYTGKTIPRSDPMWHIPAN